MVSVWRRFAPAGALATARLALPLKPPAAGALTFAIPAPVTPSGTAEEMLKGASLGNGGGVGFVLAGAVVDVGCGVGVAPPTEGTLGADDDPPPPPPPHPAIKRAATHVASKENRNVKAPVTTSHGSVA